MRDRQVDVQLIAATHQDLPELVREKSFRSDLYFRISTIPLRVPPLRERPEDIPVLAGASSRASRRPRAARVTSPRRRALPRAYAWPGNVRELRNVLERALLLCGHDVLEPATCASSPRHSAPRAEDRDLTSLEESSAPTSSASCARAAGSRPPRLGIPRSTLYQKIKKYGIDA